MQTIFSSPKNSYICHTHTHKKSVPNCNGQHRDMTTKNRYNWAFCLFRVSSSCFWFVYMSLVQVAFKYHSNRTRVCLEVDWDSSFQCLGSSC